MTVIDLNGRHALITGGLGAIGQALVRNFLASGAEVTVLDRSVGAAPAGCGWIGVDLNDLTATHAQVVATGPFDILLNNAAIIVNKPFEAFTLEEYEEQIRVNSSEIGRAHV